MAHTETILPDGVRITGTAQTGPLLDIASDACEARISLRGGQILAWTPVGQHPVLWMSPGAHTTPGKAIRGGIPICWPWFSDHPSDASKPAHGFARLRDWTLDAVERVGDETRVALSLGRVPEDDGLWPHAPRPTLAISVGAVLRLRLALSNTSQEAIAFGQLMHTYFTIGDIERIEIRGLEGQPYYDQLAGTQDNVESGAIRIDREVDRIYRHGSGAVRLIDVGLKRTIAVQQSGGDNIVVWNPWIDKTLRLADMGDADSYRGMVCIETGSTAGDGIRLAPGQSHVLETSISVITGPA